MKRESKVVSIATALPQTALTQLDPKHEQAWLDWLSLSPRDKSPFFQLLENQNVATEFKERAAYVLLVEGKEEWLPESWREGIHYCYLRDSLGSREVENAILKNPEIWPFLRRIMPFLTDAGRVMKDEKEARNHFFWYAMYAGYLFETKDTALAQIVEDWVFEALGKGDTTNAPSPFEAGLLSNAAYEQKLALDRNVRRLFLEFKLPKKVNGFRDPWQIYISAVSEISSSRRAEEHPINKFDPGVYYAQIDRIVQEAPAGMLTFPRYGYLIHPFKESNGVGVGLVIRIVDDSRKFSASLHRWNDHDLRYAEQMLSLIHPETPSAKTIARWIKQGKKSQDRAAAANEKREEETSLRERKILKGLYS